MLRRPVLVLLAAALAVSIAATPVTDEAVMAVDACGIGAHDPDVTLDAHDLCEVTMRVVAGDDTAPSVTASLRLADAPVKGSSLSTAWSIGDCMFQFRLEDDALGGTEAFVYRPSRLFVGCGAAERKCTFTSNDDLVPVDEADCWWVYEGGSTEVDIAAPTVDGDVVTFTATIDGDLTPYASLYAPGATLQQRSAFAGPDLPWFTGRSLGSVFVCDAAAGCIYVGGDLILGGGELTLSAA